MDRASRYIDALFRWRSTVVITSLRHKNKAQHMTETDKIVAATFAVARCGGLSHSKPEDYITEYDLFLRLLNEREPELAQADK